MAKTKLKKHRPLSGLSSVPVKVDSEVTMVTADLFHTARNIMLNLDAPKTTYLKILRYILRIIPYRLQVIQMLQPEDEQQCLGITNFFSSDMMKLASSRCG